MGRADTAGYSAIVRRMSERGESLAPGLRPPQLVPAPAGTADRGSSQPGRDPAGALDDRRVRGRDHGRGGRHLALRAEDLPRDLEADLCAGDVALREPRPDTIKRNLETFQRLLTTRGSSRRPRSGCRARPPTHSTTSVRVGRPVRRHHQHLGPGLEAHDSAAIANATAGAFVALHRSRTPAAALAAQAALTGSSATLRRGAPRPRSSTPSGSSWRPERPSSPRPGSDLTRSSGRGAGRSAYTPRPVRNGVLAFFAALFLGIIAALARDRLSRASATRARSAALLGLPLLVGLPFVRTAASAAGEAPARGCQRGVPDPPGLDPVLPARDEAAGDPDHQLGRGRGQDERRRRASRARLRAWARRRC